MGYLSSKAVYFFSDTRTAFVDRSTCWIYCNLFAFF
ncbi:hypothetical protein CGLO_10965 [Colletotrichum gloeosporioides Cg-14]|uniref:Uncharacterized protein n=1 Tax=Colletotrichum gloeosporioides (strain Cg-14) TaxID=1237896 RepID=T0KC41_COLGC|nr:hypothetical protein CGLO_10965 [Colletotrichum gloeosporioides Cg-14]